MRPPRHDVPHPSTIAASKRCVGRWQPAAAGLVVLACAALPALAQDANGPADEQIDKLATPGALAAAWRQGGVPATITMPAPQLTRMDTDITVQHAVPGTMLQAGDRAEISGASYRWWTSRGAADIGLGLGSIGYVVRPFGATPVGSAPMLASTTTSLSVGFRYHATESSVLYADAAAARGFDRGDAYFTKVGVEWKTAKSPLSLVRGGLGFQFDNTSRMTLNVRRGGLGIYMRSDF